jgi:hypothetical protein
MDASSCLSVPKLGSSLFIIETLFGFNGFSELEAII